MKTSFEDICKFVMITIFVIFIFSFSGCVGEEKLECGYVN